MARTQAVVDSASGLVPFGHLGWAYRSAAEYAEQAALYVIDGLAAGQWVEYVGDGDRDRLRREVDALPVPAGTDLRAVVVTPIREFYDLPADADVIDPDAAVARRVKATDHALDVGCTGFRAVVDTTTLARRPEQRAAFARFEFLIDAVMAAGPVSALCAVDRRVLGDAAGELACLHPLTGPDTVAFRLYREPDVDLALAGEVDLDDQAVLLTTLERIWPAAPGSTLTIDARDLRFVDHRTLEVLDRIAGRRETRIVLRCDQRVPTRLLGFLGPSHITVETTDPHGEELERLRRELHHRDQRLAGLPDIEQAKALLRHDLGVDDDEAFATLVRLSQQSNVKLRTVAGHVRDALLAHPPGAGTTTRAEKVLRTLLDDLRSGPRS